MSLYDGCGWQYGLSGVQEGHVILKMGGNMKNKITMCLLLFLGIIIGQFLVGTVRAAYENSGEWSASEKRQVISLLEQIAKNTRR